MPFAENTGTLWTEGKTKHVSARWSITTGQPIRITHDGRYYIFYATIPPPYNPSMDDRFCEGCVLSNKKFIFFIPLRTWTLLLDRRMGRRIYYYY